MQDDADTAAVHWYDDEHDECGVVGRHGHPIEEPNTTTVYDASQATDDDCEVCGHELLWDSVERMRYCPNTWEHQ